MEDLLYKPQKTIPRTPSSSSRGRGRGRGRGRVKATAESSRSTMKKDHLVTTKKKPVKSTKTKKAGYTGAYVIPPTRRGPIPEPVATLDFGALYPSICFQEEVVIRRF